MEGARLQIPEGALGTTAMVSVEIASPPESIAPLSRLYEFGPPGTRFSKPATVRMELLAGSPSGAVVYWSNDNGDYEKLPTRFEGTVAIAEVTHFSRGYVGAEVSPFPGCGGITEMCECRLPEPLETRLCLEEPVRVQEAACDCAKSDGTALCPAGVSYPCPSAYKGKKQDEPCDGNDSTGAAGSGKTVACVDAKWECPRWTFPAVDKVPCFKPASPLARAWQMFDDGTPPKAVPDPLAHAARAACPTRYNDALLRCWEQVNKMNCRVNKSGTDIACVQDADCRDGDVCDTAAKCGCCVKGDVPRTLTRGAALERVMTAACEEGAVRRCALPHAAQHDCVRDQADPSVARCRLRDKETWAFTAGTTPGTLDSALRNACVVKRTDARCLWKFDLPLAEAMSRGLAGYREQYECGGVNCLGVPVYWIAADPAETYVARVVDDGCAP